jgi:hypothetical protein
MRFLFHGWDCAALLRTFACGCGQVPAQSTPAGHMKAALDILHIMAGPIGKLPILNREYPDCLGNSAVSTLQGNFFLIQALSGQTGTGEQSTMIPPSEGDAVIRWIRG